MSNSAVARKGIEAAAATTVAEEGATTVAAEEANIAQANTSTFQSAVNYFKQARTETFLIIKKQYQH